MGQSRMTRWLAAGLLSSLGGCASFPSPAAEESETSSEGDVGSVLGTILLYLPNRVFDLVEIVRVGANVGPGIGVDAEVTQWVRAGTMSRTTVGLGYQGLRRMPLSASSENYIALGPLAADATAGPSWYRGPGDVRAEVHALLVGVHAAVDVWGIFDFVVGLAGFDPEEDDFAW